MNHPRKNLQNCPRDKLLQLLHMSFIFCVPGCVGINFSFSWSWNWKANVFVLWKWPNLRTDPSPRSYKRTQ